MATYLLIASGDWSDPANWLNLANNASGVPGPGDTAMFSAEGADEVTGIGNVGTLDGGPIMNGATLTTQSITDAGIQLLNNATLTVDGAFSLASSDDIDVSSGVLTTDGAVTGDVTSETGGMEVDSGGIWIANATVSGSRILSSGNFSAGVLSDLSSLQIGGGSTTAGSVSVQQDIVIQSAQVTLGDVSILGTPPGSLPAMEIYGQSTVTTGTITGNASLTPFSNANLEVLGSGTSLTVNGDVSMLAALVAGTSSNTLVTGNVEENQLLIGGDDTSGLPTKVLVVGNIDIGTGGTPVATTSEVSAGGFLSFAGVLTVGADAGWNNTLEVDDDTAETGDFGTTTLLPGYVTGPSVDIGTAGIGTLDIEAGSEVELTGPATIGNGTPNMDTLIVDGANSVLNASTITVSGGDATVNAGGELLASNVAFSTAEVTVEDGGVVSATDAASGVDLTDFTNITLSNGTISGRPLVEFGSSISGFGTLVGRGINDGLIFVTGGTLTVTDNWQGSGTFVIEDFSALYTAGGFSSSSGLVEFNPSGDSESLIVPDQEFAPTIQDFAVGDVIDVQGVSFTNVIYTPDGGGGDLGTLDIIVAGVPEPTFVLEGSYTTAQFQPSPSPDGTYISLGYACYAAGTRILTERGEVAVDNLVVGDRVMTLSAPGSAPLVWLGHRRVDCEHHPRPRDVWPVRIRAQAFGPDRPHRDLLLSPDHAVFVNGVLVPVKLLVNGTSIVQVKRDQVTYYHVELPEHAVILAEGLTVESYLDAGDRTNFDAGETIRLFPDFTARFAPDTATLWETGAAAPLVMTGPKLAAARQAIVENAARHRSRSAKSAAQVG